MDEQDVEWLEEKERESKRIQWRKRREWIGDKAMTVFFAFAIIFLIVGLFYAILLETGAIKDTCPECETTQPAKCIHTFVDRKGDSVRMCEGCLLERLGDLKQSSDEKK